MGAKAVIGMYFTAELSTLRERVKDYDDYVTDTDVVRLYNTMQETPPHIDEGFDELITVDTTFPTSIDSILY